MAEYIERDVAKRELFAWATCLKRPQYLAKEDALHVLDLIPAADVAPVVHGRWEEADWVELDDSGAEFIRTPKAALRCSHCKIAFKKELLWRNKYCPNCGARMDGEADADD